MSLYAISDMHLGFQAHISMDVFGDEWKGHSDNIKANCERLISSDDTLLIIGDHSWGISLSMSRADLEYISDLPGRKILLRGNHDRFWPSSRTEALNNEYDGRLFFLNNNFFTYNDYAIIGSKGYAAEDNEDKESAEKMTAREVIRFRRSLEAARNAGYVKFICCTHYPPTTRESDQSPFTEIARECGAEYYLYGHLHGRDNYGNSLSGLINGTDYELVSADYLNFRPKKILT